MDFCGYLNQEGPLGPYRIVLPLKARKALAARDFTLFMMNRLNWVEDGIRVVLRVILTGEGKTSDYLRIAYPETFAERQKKTETDETRRTLLYRFRYLLRCMALVASQYMEFRQWGFTGLRISLEVFVECVRQAAGEAAAARLGSWVNRFARLWQTVDFGLTDESSVCRELHILLDELDAVFETLGDAFRTREGELLAEKEKADEIAALRAAQEESNRLQREGLRRCAALSAKTALPDDPYSQLAGLGRVSAAQREELLACFRYSHEKFAVVRGDRLGARSLGRLAERVWKQNDERFTALAKLKVAPGYKNIRSLAAKLYKLATAFPEADHFRWEV